MPTYSTPGVYAEEINVFPPSVAPVATAIPAFIGCTEFAKGTAGEPLTKVPVRIKSLLEFERFFGEAPVHDLSVNVNKRVNASGSLLGVGVTWKDDKEPTLPDFFLYYSMQLYFANGGGPCYVYSIAGLTGAAPDKAAYTAAITALEAVDEVTILAFPDAVNLGDVDYGSVADAALASCNKTQDRFAVLDVRGAVVGGTDDNAKVSSNFRGKLNNNTVEFLKYGAAYFPYIETNLPFNTADAKITMTTCNLVKVADDGTEASTAIVAANKKLNDNTANLKVKETAVYNAVKAFVAQAWVTLPPSGAVTGAYARVDRTRGVWKAPANVGLMQVVATAVDVTNDLQDGLNIDATSGKSVNAVRSFFSKGTLIWGARTLAGNDSEWKYVSVRRFANYVEESVKKATGVFVFEPNNANTWVKVRSMIENFLINQWRDGALMGAKPEHAFKVAVGLGQTMTPQDILDGFMIVEIHLAIVRPAEFIVLRFMQKMPQS